MKKKVIIFDLDGVLIDSPKLVLDYFLHMFPTLTKEIMDDLLSENFHEKLEKFKETNSAREQTDEEKEMRSKAYAAEKAKSPLYPGIIPMLNRLHEDDYILTINSSAFERNCLPVLENSGIKNLFEFIGTAEISKSKVEKFKIIEEKYAVSKDEMIFVTDTLGDVHEAGAVLIPTVAVTWGAHDASHFKHESHSNLIAIVDSVQELEKIIHL